jgi:hypothetical protein
MKYTDFLIRYTFEDGSHKDRLVSYVKPMDVDYVYEYAETVACMEDMDVVDIEVKGLDD